MATPLTGFLTTNVTVVLQDGAKVTGVLSQIGDDMSVLIDRDNVPGLPPGTTVATWIPYGAIIIISAST